MADHEFVHGRLAALVSTIALATSLASCDDGELCAGVGCLPGGASDKLVLVDDLSALAGSTIELCMNAWCSSGVIPPQPSTTTTTNFVVEGEVPAGGWLRRDSSVTGGWVTVSFGTYSGDLGHPRKSGKDVFTATLFAPDGTVTAAKMWIGFYSETPSGCGGREPPCKGMQLYPI